MRQSWATRGKDQAHKPDWNYVLRMLPHRPSARSRHLLVAAGIALAAVTAGGAAHPKVAEGAVGDGITAYIGAPFVQGPPSSFGATIETFNSWSSCGSLPASSVGTFTGSCDLHDGASYVWGGAQTTTDTPTVQSGGTPSKFVSGPSTGELTLTFASPVKYVGFWWSSGSASDTVKFYDASSTLLATFTTASLKTKLGNSTPYSVPFPGPTTLTALNGTAYKRDYYWGRPYAYTTTTPTALAAGANTEAHAYLNVHARGGIEFSKVEFIGNAFEFDNVAISTSSQSAASSNVFIESVLGKSVEFRPNGGAEDAYSQTSTAATTLTANTFTRAGYTFTGWNTQDDGLGTPYADGVSYNFAADLILFAQWSGGPTTTTDSSATTTTDPTSTTNSSSGDGGSMPQSGVALTGVASTGMIALLAGITVLAVGVTRRRGRPVSRPLR